MNDAHVPDPMHAPESHVPAPARPAIDAALLETDLSALDAAGRLRWAWEAFGKRAAVGTSFQGAGLATIHIARTAGLDIPVFTLDTGLLFPETLETWRRLEEFFAAQSTEGWFPEYGGADTGYLSVTLDALADYGSLTGDPRAAAAMERALGFIGSLLSVAGSTPVMTNARSRGMTRSDTLWRE